MEILSSFVWFRTIDEWKCFQVSVCLSVCLVEWKDDTYSLQSVLIVNCEVRRLHCCQIDGVDDHTCRVRWYDEGLAIVLMILKLSIYFLYVYKFCFLLEHLLSLLFSVYFFLLLKFVLLFYFVVGCWFHLGGFS